MFVSGSEEQLSVNTDSHIIQIDGNDSIFSNTFEKSFNADSKIPVHVSNRRLRKSLNSGKRVSVRKVLKRNNIVMQALELPIVMNLNPRSIYNKADDLKLLIEQYEVDVVCISESWERDNLRLKDLIQMENYKVISTVKRRDFLRGNPALIINSAKYHIKEICLEPITVPVGVEAIWALISPKQKSQKSKINQIAICSFYYRGPKSTAKKELFDHIASAYHYLCSKYGSDTQFIIAADANRLNLAPILNLSSSLQQMVKVPTRLNPDRTLDPIITSLVDYYRDPVTKPPINSDVGKRGVASDHLVVLMQPLTKTRQIQPRIYKSIKTGPINVDGLRKFSKWVENCDWSAIYECSDANKKAEIFQALLLEKFEECFPLKIIKVSNDDKPWFTSDLKTLDRRRKREFFKNQKSEHWMSLNKLFLERSKAAKAKYYEDMVCDLKESNPRQWHSKLKRMSGQEVQKQEEDKIEHFEGCTPQEQAELIANYYAEIATQYDELRSEDFPDYTKHSFSPPTINPWKVYKVIESLNKKATTVPGDVPVKIMVEFSVELATPLAHIFNSCLEQGVYPAIFKRECVTPAPKKHPPESISDLRKISGLLTAAKVFDKILSEFIISDMAASRDVAQYGNEKNTSIQHYLINLLHKVLVATDRKVKSEVNAVLLGMIDWKQAFDRQCLRLGIQSFIDNGCKFVHGSTLFGKTAKNPRNFELPVDKNSNSKFLPAAD